MKAFLNKEGIYNTITKNLMNIFKYDIFESGPENVFHKVKYKIFNGRTIHEVMAITRKINEFKTIS